MRSLCYILVLLARAFQLISAQGSNTITVPPNGFEVTAGQPSTIEWTNPSLRTVTIQLVPASGTGKIITLASTLENSGNATFLIPSDIPTTQEYKFKILDDSNSSNVNFSPAFNIAPPNSLPSSTSTAAPSSAAAIPASTSSSTTPSSGHSLSTGAIAGMSVGIVLGVLVFAGIAIFLYRRRRKHKTWMQEQQQPQPSSVATDDHRSPPYDPNHKYEPMHPQAQLNEVSGSRSWPREMEGESRYQQSEIVELPAGPMDEGLGFGKK